MPTTLAPDDPLFSARIKVARAQRHIEELEANITAFHNSGPYETIAEDDPKTGDQVFKLKLIHDIPVGLSAIIGDAVHNIRSAYDSIIYAAVLNAGNTPNDSTGFPIYRELKSLQARGARKIVGISAKAERIFYALKPYRSGNSALWELHRLDVTDKHKTIIPMWARVRGVDLMSVMMTSLPEDLKQHYKSTRGPSRQLLVNPSDKQPLHNGSEVFRVRKQARRPSENMEPEVVIELAFGEDGITGRPIIDTLREQLCFAQRVIGIFERRVFRHH